MAAHVLYYMFALFVDALVPTDVAYRLLCERFQQVHFVPTTFFETFPQAYAAGPYLIGVPLPRNVVDQLQYVKNSSLSSSSSRS